MKKNTYTVKGPKGVTLIELTVVIAIILLLISILFIGAKFYKDGADKSACVVNINGIQKAVRSVQNLENKKDQDAATPDVLAATDFSGTVAAPANQLPLPVLPACPTADTAYTLLAVYPTLGIPVATCADANYGGTVLQGQTDSKIHAPSNTDGW